MQESIERGRILLVFNDPCVNVLVLGSLVLLPRIFIVDTVDTWVGIAELDHLLCYSYILGGLNATL